MSWVWREDSQWWRVFPIPPGADEVVRTIDEVLAGLYTGDMDIAMERCAAFAHVARWASPTMRALPARIMRFRVATKRKREAVERRAACRVRLSRWSRLRTIAR